MYKDFPGAEAPMICSMGISCEVPLVDSALGLVQAGSLCHTSNQQRQRETHSSMLPHHLHLYLFRITVCSHPVACLSVVNLNSSTLTVSRSLGTWPTNLSVLSDHKVHVLNGIRRPRLTASKFREICQVIESSEDSLADRILQGTHQTAAMKRGLEMEADAIWEYCQMKRVNHYPCGFVIHPDAPWLRASPDGLIFNPSEPFQLGLIEIKCPNVKSYVDCPYLKMSSGKLELKQTHAYYSQVQGQMLITGMNYCDFVVSAEEDIPTQRIYKNSYMCQVIKDKVVRYYFHVYMQKCM